MITYNRRVYVKLRKNYRLEVQCYFAIIFYLMKHTYYIPRRIVTR